MNADKPISADVIYENILWYLEERGRAEAAQKMLFENIESIKGQLSWNLNEENLKLLHRCVNESSSLDDETWTQTRNEFIISAFKDLSSFRNPRAMGIFERLRTICTMNDGELLLWARTITKRTDGSAVIVMHVSNLEAFEGMLHKESGEGFLQEGLMIFQ